MEPDPIHLSIVVPALDEAASDAERARAQNPDGSLLALLTRVGTIWKPEKVFDWTA